MDGSLDGGREPHQTRPYANACCQTLKACEWEETRQDLAAANNNGTPQVTLGRGAGGGGIGRLLTSVSLNMDSSGFFTLSARASSSISGAPEPC